MTTTAGTTADTATTTQVHRVYIKAEAQRIWDAITQPEWTRRYGYTGVVDSDWQPGSPYLMHPTASFKAAAEAGVGEHLEVLHHAEPRHLQLGLQLGERAPIAHEQEVEQEPTGGVGERLERTVELVVAIHAREHR